MLYLKVLPRTNDSPLVSVYMPKPFALPAPFPMNRLKLNSPSLICVRFLRDSERDDPKENSEGGCKCE
jgi:hypothetical protein